MCPHESNKICPFESNNKCPLKSNHKCPLLKAGEPSARHAPLKIHIYIYIYIHLITFISLPTRYVHMSSQYGSLFCFLNLNLIHDECMPRSLQPNALVVTSKLGVWEYTETVSRQYKDPTLQSVWMSRFTRGDRRYC